MAIEGFFAELTFWHWLILGIVLIVVEMLAPGVVFLWLGLAAIGTGVILAAAPAMGWEYQVLVFAVLAAIAVYGGRRFVASRMTASDHPTLNQRGAGYVGRTYVLAEPLHGGAGKLVIDDATWRIAGPDAPAGAGVRIVGMDGKTLLVEPIDGHA